MAALPDGLEADYQVIKEPGPFSEDHTNEFTFLEVSRGKNISIQRLEKSKHTGVYLREVGFGCGRGKRRREGEPLLYMCFSIGIVTRILCAVAV